MVTLVAIQLGQKSFLLIYNAFIIFGHFIQKSYEDKFFGKLLMDFHQGSTGNYKSTLFSSKSFLT